MDADDVKSNRSRIDNRLRECRQDWNKERRKYKYSNPVLGFLAFVSLGIVVVYVASKLLPQLGDSPIPYWLAIGALLVLVLSAGYHRLYQVPKRASFYSTVVGLADQLRILLDRANDEEDYDEIEKSLAALQIRAKEEIPQGASLTVILSEIKDLVPLELPSEKRSR